MIRIQKKNILKNCLSVYWLASEDGELTDPVDTTKHPLARTDLEAP